MPEQPQNALKSFLYAIGAFLILIALYEIFRPRGGNSEPAPVKKPCSCHDKHEDGEKREISHKYIVVKETDFEQFKKDFNLKEPIFAENGAEPKKKEPVK